MRRICIQVCSRMGLALLAFLPLGCTHFDPVTGSTLVGSGLGATAGGIIGHQSGNTGAGALIGAAAGALGGALVGDAQQARVERDAAFAYADGVQAQQYSAAAVTNSDVIYMAQNGLGDDVIINAISTRGGRFDTSPSGLIGLRSAGVSNVVISAMQNAGPAVLPVSYVAPPPPPPSVIFVDPPPPPPIIWGRYYGGPRYRHHHHHPPRSGISIYGRF